MHKRNQERAAAARRTLGDYAHHKNVAKFPKHEEAEMVTDFLADLRHMCEAHGIDFYACLDSSYNHYLEERKNPNE